VRLLATHSELESERVQALIDAVGDVEVWKDPHAYTVDAKYAIYIGYLWAGRLSTSELF